MKLPVFQFKGNPLDIRKHFRLKNISRRELLIRLGQVFIGLLFCIAILFAWYAKDLPTPGKVAKRKAVESTTFFDRNGKELYQTGEFRRTVVESKDISEASKQAAVAVEDKTFFQHHGFNFKGIFRAALRDIVNLSPGEGGSTITQQYVKNALLSPRKTLDRKIRELILSIEVEQIFNKDQILTAYLNEIPYGGNIYGIETASETYFGKHAKELNLSEAATLAAIPKSPTYYYPYGQHRDDLVDRKNFVLDEMVEMNYITQVQADEAKTQKPKKGDYGYIDRKENIAAPHYVLYVRDKLIEKYGEQLVTEGGLKVTTTLDLEKQVVAEKAVEDGAKRNASFKAGNASLVSIDPKTGQIIAMVGSKDYFDTENDGNVNVATANRQPGSSFKPIVYATAFKGKYSPASTLFDLETSFGNYTPKNYNGRNNGPVSIRFALANSLNVPAVKMLDLVGIDNALETARDLGITTLKDRDRYGLALVLGGGEVKPIEMASAFGTFANEGIHADLNSVLKVEDKNGKVLEEYKDKKNQRRVLDPQVAYLTSHVLSDNGARSAIFGSNSPLYFPGRTVAAKTGTTDSFRDAWTVGFTPDLATAIWVGNNDNTPMKQGSDGSVIAAPIFHQFMASALKDVPNKEFNRPAGIQEVAVDKLSGKLPNEYSPQVIRDIFASWNVPTDRDDIHIKVKINKSNGKLATDNTPPNLVEERLFTNVHSERPNLPNWENPVRGWARSNGMDALPPTDKDDTYSSPDDRPKVTITTPGAGDVITGENFSVYVNLNARYGVRQVDYLIDNNTLTTTSNAPYSATIQTKGITPGTHQLTARVVDNNGGEDAQTIDLQINSSGLAVSSISISSIGKNSANIRFDLSREGTSWLRLGPGPGNYNINLTDPSASHHEYNVSGLVPATKYYFIISANGSDGSSGVSTEQSFTTTN